MPPWRSSIARRARRAQRRAHGWVRRARASKRTAKVRDPLGNSRVGLVGSGEFTAAMAEIDRTILGKIGGAPHVVILPTAAAGENPRSWAVRGIEHFEALGARSVALMVLDREDAENPAHA